METKKLIRIIQRAKNGDSNAQQELYLDSSKSVYFLALKILKNPDDAEDIMQDVFVTVFEKLPKLKQPAAYYKWVNQITANKCMSFLRKKRPLPSGEEEILDALELEGEEDVETPETLYDDGETRRLIMDIIDTLPDAQRECVMYRYFSQLTIEEIAAITETNVHTVKSRLALARQKIRAAILEQEEKEEIHLHAIIPITPVLMKTLEDFRMPDGLNERIWGTMAEGAGKAAGMAAKHTLSFAAKMIVGVAAGILVAGGIIAGTLSARPSETNTPPISSTAAVSAQPSVQPSAQPTVQASDPSAEPSVQSTLTPSAEDYTQYYKPVLENYRAFSLLKADDLGESADLQWYYSVEVLAHADDPKTDFGYALHDLNGNGIPELILLSKCDPYICAIYSLVDHIPNLLDDFWTRYTCEIGADGTLYIHGSGGAFDSYTAAYTIAPDGKSLILIEEFGIESYDSSTEQRIDSPRYYRIDAGGVKTILSEDEANDAWQRFDEVRSNEWDLSFTPLW